MTVAALFVLMHSVGPIFDDSLQHIGWYGCNSGPFREITDSPNFQAINSL